MLHAPCNTIRSCYMRFEDEDLQARMLRTSLTMDGPVKRDKQKQLALSMVDYLSLIIHKQKTKEFTCALI